jgi:hypothetical protein
MFDVKRLLACLTFVLTVALVGAHDASAQNGAITNPGPLPVLVNSVVEPTIITGIVATPFMPIVIQPQFVVTPSVNPKGVGITDPLGNPYRNVTPNPLTISNVPTPVVSRFAIPVIQNPS